PAPQGLAVGDVNGDNIPDLVVVGDGGAGAVEFGDGTGNFTPGPVFSPVAAAPAGLVLRDFNNDGHMDLAVLDMAPVNNVVLLPGDGTGTFSSYTLFTAESNPTSFAAADFDRNGNLDLVSVDDSTLNVLAGQGNGGFQTGPSLSVPTYSVASPVTRGLVVGDFNNDGAPDLVTLNSDGFAARLNEFPPTITSAN